MVSCELGVVMLQMCNLVAKTLIVIVLSVDRLRDERSDYLHED